jgi:hypothetical protein
VDIENTNVDIENTNVDIENTNVDIENTNVDIENWYQKEFFFTSFLETIQTTQKNIVYCENIDKFNVK